MNIYYIDEEDKTLAMQISVATGAMIAKYTGSNSEDMCFLIQKQNLYIKSDVFGKFNCKEFYDNLVRKRYKTNDLLIKTIKTYCSNGSVLDITAGFGQDSLIIALSKYRVTMVEINQNIAVILFYLCHLFNILGIKCVINDNVSFLRMSNNYDVIYYDPMFNDKKSISKKHIEILKMLGSNTLSGSNDELYELCMNKCNLLIVKRDNKQKPVFPNPEKQIYGNIVRFDIYLSF